MQRHHLLPRNLQTDRRLSALFDALGRGRVSLDDFRSNGLLLPALEQAAMVLGLPLHRGPHPRYNEVVAERFGQIEASWQNNRGRDPEQALRDVVMRMRLLQAALRRTLLQPAAPPRLRLNLRDPVGQGVDFAELDAMADAIWAVTQTEDGDKYRACSA